MRGAIVVIALCLGSISACAGNSPPPILTPTLPEPSIASATAVDAAVEEAPLLIQASADNAPGPGLSPAVVTALQGIPMYVATLDGMLLFADEQLQAQEILAAWARREGLTVVPPKQTSDLLARAALGQHAITGKACGAPLDADRALDRWRVELGARGKLAAIVYCDPDCVVQVTVSIGLQGEGGSEFYAAPFDPTRPWKDELAARLVTITDNGGHDRHGHLNNPVKPAGIAHPIGVVDILDDHSHAPVPGGPANERTAIACLAGVQHTELQLEYSPRGTVARCEVSAGQVATPIACICRALARQIAAAGSRAHYTVNQPLGAQPVTAEHVRISAYATRAMVADPDQRGRFIPLTTDPALARWDPPDEIALAPCVVGMPSTAGEIVLRASVDFDPVGKATKAIITPWADKPSERWARGNAGGVAQIHGVLAPAAGQCLHDTFMRVRVPCPSVAAASVVAEVHVSFSKPEK